MNVYIRADANHSIGMGHIMRMLSVAESFSNAGHTISFVIADNGVSKLIHERGYEVKVLHSDYTKMDDEWKLWTELTADLIIVDSYYVTASYLQFLYEKVNRNGGKLVYFDDVCKFPYPVNILVNYNAYADIQIYKDLYKNSGIEEPEYILAPKYAPLRSMFRNLPKRAQQKNVHNILFSTGGSDKLHLTLQLIRYLAGREQARGRIFHFLLGVMNTDKETIRAIADEMDDIVLHENVADMKSLIEGMDLAVSAAGSTLYEICACGVPLITFSFANNQISGADAFKRLGLAINIGDLRNPASGELEGNAAEMILSALNKLSDDYSGRVDMSARMQEMIDGFGADRIVQRISRNKYRL